MVEAGPHAPALRAALADEPAAVTLVETTTTATIAIVRARLVDEDEALRLTVQDGSKNVLVDRRLSLEHGMDPAVRMARLLVLGALGEPETHDGLQHGLGEGAAEVPPGGLRTTPVERLPAAPSVAHVITIGGGLGLAGEATAIEAHARVSLASSLRAGLLAIGAGLLCCTHTTNAIEADVRALDLFAAMELDLYGSGPWDVAVVLAPGVSFGAASIRARTPPFAAPGTTSEHAFVEAAVLAAGRLALALGRSSLVLQAGARVALAPPSFQLPTAFAGGGGEPLQLPNLEPFLVVGVEVDLLRD